MISRRRQQRLIDATPRMSTRRWVGSHRHVRAHLNRDRAGLFVTESDERFAA
jgi:hypothetical protein